jgi:hypothetical protein
MSRTVMALGEVEEIRLLRQFVLDLSACGDVLCASFVVESAARNVADSADVFRNPDRTPVFTFHFVFEVVDDAFFVQQPLELFPSGWLRVALPLYVVSFADQFLGAGEAKHPRQRRIGRNEAAFGRVLEDSFRGVLEDGTVFFVRLAQLSLHGFSLTVILHDHLDRGPSFVEE